MTPDTLHITCIASMVFGTTPDEIKSRDRHQSITDCRKACMLLTWLLMQPITITKIGYDFLRDHATVINQISKALDLIETDKEFRRKFELIGKILMG